MSQITEGFQDVFLGGAERKAASAQEEAIRAGERTQQAQQAEARRQFEVTQGQFEPYREAGGRALAEQEALTGTLGAEAQREAFARFQESPGQAFLRERQEQSLLRNQAAIGGLGGGQVRTALQQQGVGFAQQDLQNQLARLNQLRTGGFQATTGLGAGRAGLTQQLGQGATNISNLQVAGGQARAGGILGSAAQFRAFEEQGYSRNMEMAETGGEIFGSIYGGGAS